MRSFFSGILALAIGLGLGIAPARAQSRQVRLGLVAGNNAGKDPARSLRYAEDEVGRLADLLRNTGDFDDIVTLRGASRAEIEKGLVEVRQKLAAAKADGNQTLFLFYYSGHGDNEALEIGSERLPLRDLRGYLEQLSAADVRVAFVDACQSGALTGVKGGRRAPGYEVRLADPGQVKGMAIVTSSTSNEFSQESDDLKGSFFSQSIMAGLRGAADSSHDGQVTLSEVYQFAFKRTLASTAASLTGGQHPTYDYRMAGAGEVVLTRTRAKDARLAFVREAGSTYTVVSRTRDEVIAEVPSSAGEDLYLALPAGEYRVIRRTMGNVSERNLALGPGSVTTVDPNGMIAVPQGSPRNKGGDLELRNRLGAYAGVSTSIVPGSSYLGTFALSYGRDLRWATLCARVSAASFDSQQDIYRSSLLRASANADLLLPLLLDWRWSIQLGPTVGVPMLRQRDMFGRVSNSYGFAYGGAVVVSMHVYARTYLSLNLDGGGEFFRLDGERVHRATGSALMGGAVAF
jgi:Caspase domain